MDSGDARPSVRNPYIAGSPVTGPEMFVGREDVLEFVGRTLPGTDGRNVVVLHGQRRVGKTSLLYQLRRRGPGDHHFMLVDLQGFSLDGLRSLLWELAVQLARDAGRELGVDVATPSRSAFEDDARHAFRDEFLPALRAAVGDRQPVLMIDEADRLFESVRSGRLEPATYGYLRQLARQDRCLGLVLSMTGNVEDAMRESDGLFDRSCRRSISFLSRAAAETLITRPVEPHYTLTPDAVERILEITGGHPYYTQLLCHCVFNVWQQEPVARRMGARDVEQAALLAVDLGAANLKHTWDEADAPERVVMSCLAVATGESGREPVGIRAIVHRGWRYDLDLEGDDYGSAIGRLLARDVLVRDAGYRFAVDLLRLWVADHWPPEGVAQEMPAVDRNPPTRWVGPPEVPTHSEVVRPWSIDPLPALSARTTTAETVVRHGPPLVDLPPTPEVDPRTVVMPAPAVPGERRFCAGCGQEVGRTSDGVPGPAEGFCPRCGEPFSFAPALRQGDLVAGQYRVAGCLAYGGLGWIYLATDERVANRWVVLKGLLNSRDPALTEAALAEQRFLARVEHPNIVRIYNFVQHGGAGYIVMEYVGGRTLKQVLEERRRAGQGPLPLELAIAYVLAILPAFAHLHRLGLAYNDCKPANMMLHGDDVKLIDLGAVTNLGEGSGVVYGTEGYRAPEVAHDGPSIASDLYTIARCLAVLALDGAEAEPLLRRHESFRRFLGKATAPRAGDRFQSADAMAEQLQGVLREALVLNGGAGQPVASTLFLGDQQPLLADAGGLALVRTQIELGDHAEAEKILDHVEAENGPDWRVAWYRALSLLARGRAAEAQQLFDAVCTELSGELAPKLALGLAAELAADLDTAGRMYGLVAEVGPEFTSACFGLARVRRAQGDRAGAAAAYELIPRTSRLHPLGLRAMVQTLLEAYGAERPSLADIAFAAEIIESLVIESRPRAELSANLLETALELLESRAVVPSDVLLLDTPLHEGPIRAALEQVYRDLARMATGDERVRWADRADRLRRARDARLGAAGLEIVIGVRRDASSLQLADDLSEEPFRLTGGSVLIGRAGDCDITLPDPTLSRRHAQIVEVDGTWCVQDFGSANGTLVNGKPLTAGVPHAIRPGDRIALGAFFDLTVRSAAPDPRR